MGSLVYSQFEDDLIVLGIAVVLSFASWLWVKSAGSVPVDVPMTAQILGAVVLFGVGLYVGSLEVEGYVALLASAGYGLSIFLVLGLLRRAAKRRSTMTDRQPPGADRSQF